MAINKISVENLDFRYLNLNQAKLIHYQLSPAELVECAIRDGEGLLADSGALAADTGEFTGRSPRDRVKFFGTIFDQAGLWGLL